MSSASKAGVGEMAMNAARIVSSLLGVDRSSAPWHPARNPFTVCGVRLTVWRCPIYCVAVPDLKPPRLATDERDTLLTMLQFQRESLVRKVTGAPSDTGSPVGSGTTLLWLVRHLAWAELLWIADRFAGLSRVLPADSISSRGHAGGGGRGLPGRVGPGRRDRGRGGPGGHLPPR